VRPMMISEQEQKDELNEIKEKVDILRGYL
jgi:hypothetical protein